jgi:hypothetical protein
MQYYLNRNRTALTVIDDSEAAAGGTEVSVMYSYIPSSMESDEDEPEFPEQFHIALVHGTISLLFGDQRHEKMYFDKIKEARATSKNSAFMSLKQYEY